MCACTWLCVSVCEHGYACVHKVVVSMCVEVCLRACVRVPMVQGERTFLATNTKVLVLTPLCSCFFICRMGVALHADTEVNPMAKHKEIALLDIKLPQTQINEMLETKVFSLLRFAVHSGRMVGSGFVLGSWRYIAFPSERPVSSSVD